MPKAPQNLKEFNSLLKVVEDLRGPDGCPWDKEQTHATLTRYMLEEAYELCAAIDAGDAKEICDELGDVLLQVVLHAEIAQGEGRFDIFDVIQNLNEKMIRRHPHVFANTKARNSDEVLHNWAAIKAQEKGSAADQPLSFDIPDALPALLRSQKIGEKTKKVAFDWANAEECWPKIREELDELAEACKDGEATSAIEDELGDVLFSVAQLARHLKLDSEQALRKTNLRFEQRFRRMQELVLRDHEDWATLSPERREQYWKRAKA